MLKDFLHGKPFRHPLHSYLVHFPIGLFSLSLLLDIASVVFPSVPGLVTGAFYSLLAGIVMALLAAVPGLVDYLDIPKDRPTRKIATAHMVLNLIAVATFAVGAGWRVSELDAARTPMMPLILSAVAMGIIVISGYLGGHLVFDDGVGVGRHRRDTSALEALRFSTRDAAAKGWEANDATVFVPVARADAVRDHEALRVRIDELEMVVTKVEGNFYAFQEYCPHRYGPLSEGCFANGQVVCPWHRSGFDVRTGKVVKGPAKVDLRTFQVEVRRENVCIAVPRVREQSTTNQDQRKSI